jgi:type IV pilus assembly protein PilB
MSHISFLHAWSYGTGSAHMSDIPGVVLQQVRHYNEFFLLPPKLRKMNAMPSPTLQDQSSKVYSSLVDVLVDQGKISPGQADDISLEQVRTNKDPNRILEDKHFVSEIDLAQAKSIFYHVPYIDLSTVGASPEALSQISDGTAKMYHMLPFALDRANGEISVAMADPLDLSAIEFVERKTGLQIVPYIAPASDIEKAVNERYAQSLSNEVTAALQDTVVTNQKNVLIAGQTDEQISAGEVVRDAPIAKIVETILTFALKSNASDVHIEAMEDKTRIRYRIDGLLQERLVLPKSVHEAVVSRIKILSNLKIDEKRQPQDGRFTFRMADREVDLRVSTLPTVHGEKVVMRLLQKSADVPTLTDLGMRGEALRHIQEAIHIPHGIILVTGPTGSGKTTTLYSILDKINRPEVNIVTLEDPVEYQMEGVNQVQVNPQAGLTFASGLRSFLRQDPNIIMVGEIRDEETANLAIQASLTGHLVFSTIHTSSASGALPRLLDMKAEPFLLASSMTLVMGQRVPRKVNQEKVEDYHPEEAVIKDIEATLGGHFTKYLQEHKLTRDTIMLKRKRPDLPPNQSEYRGRTGIYEVLPITPVISKMILEKQSAAEIEKQATKDGMLLMKQDGYLKALEGITTLEEVLRVAQI